MEKYYLNEIIVGFDVNDLNETVWVEDENGWYTTDSQEVAWFKELAESCKKIDELGVDTTGFIEYQDYIDYAKEV